MYPLKQFTGLDNVRLVAHPCRPLALDKDMIEIHSPGAILTREQFAGMVAWVSHAAKRD